MLGSSWSEAFQRGGQDGKEAIITPEQIITALREAEVGLARGKSVKLIPETTGVSSSGRRRGG